MVLRKKKNYNHFMFVKRLKVIIFIDMLISKITDGKLNNNIYEHTYVNCFIELFSFPIKIALLMIIHLSNIFTVHCRFIIIVKV